MPTLRVNQFTDGTTGHVNISFLDDSGNVIVTYGANLSPSAGVQDETDRTSDRIALAGNAYSYSDIQISQSQYDQAIAVAYAASLLNSSYFGMCNNCVDFANVMLEAVGQSDWAIADYLLDNTLTDTYAKAAKYICGSTYVDLGTSAILNILASPQNVSDAVNFVAALSWLVDHENGSDFYMNYPFSDYNDPDADAWTQLYLVRHYAAKLGISVDYDPIESKIHFGVASPIVVDLNGDGIQTTNYFQHAVEFDIDGDGVKDKTAWVSGGDAFLAIDSNGNGQIDGVQELFGGLDRGMGYAKLAQFDGNTDGVVDAHDSGYALLQIWQDANMNGATDEGELRVASEAGLESISVNYQSQDVYQNGNLLGEVSEVVLNGQAQDAADVYFRYQSGIDSAEVSRQVDALIAALATFSPSPSADTAVEDGSMNSLLISLAANEMA